MPATDREHLITVVCGLSMTVGLFLDGYFHQNLERATESFVTPWHVVFYAGFTATALWLASMSRRRGGRSFDRGIRTLPPGYDGARLGLGVFAVGATGDVAWHAAFGVERGIDALLSPTHLLLFAGLALILTAPFRSTASAAGVQRPWITAGSLISVTALAGFVVNFAWGLGIAALARSAYDPITEAGETDVIAGIASMLVTTAVLFGAARLLLAAGRPAPGAMSALFGVTAALVAVAFDEDVEGVVAAVVAGVMLDLLGRTRATHRVAFVFAATTLWSTYLGLLALDGVAWPPEIWIGAIMLNALAAAAVGPGPPEATAPSS